MRVKYLITVLFNSAFTCYLTSKKAVDNVTASQINEKILIEWSLGDSEEILIK